MPTRVKICGLSTASTLDAALNTRADYVGLVFFPKSPRHVSLSDAAALADRARNRASIVALVVDPTNDQLADIIVSVRPNMLQLHGTETPQRAAEIREVFSIEVMKAIAVSSTADAAKAIAYRNAADLILFDAKPSNDAHLPGGNGITFDWTALDQVKHQIRYMLSGGLTPENVADAIRATGTEAVDVSSGVESAPGVKSNELIRAFVHAAKHATST
jgi:phosphoribosylanthranilate isomerase